MLTLEWTQTRHGDVTLVGAVVSSDAPTARRARVAVRIDGPVWPPRRRGVPEAGWDGDCFEAVVPPGGRRSLGFASPGRPVEPPIELVADERAPNEAVVEGAPPLDAVALDGGRPPDAVVRSLGDCRPPSDAVPVALDDPDGTASDQSDDATSNRSDDPCNGATGDPDDEPGRDGVATERTGCRADPPRVQDEPLHESDPSASRDEEGLPPAVDTWMSDVESRAARAEDVASAKRLTAAARAVEAAGGLAGVEQLQSGLHADADALRTLADQADELADRCERVADELPISALRRLA